MKVLNSINKGTTGSKTLITSNKIVGIICFNDFWTESRVKQDRMQIDPLSKPKFNLTMTTTKLEPIREEQDTKIVTLLKPISLSYCTSTRTDQEEKKDLPKSILLTYLGSELTTAHSSLDAQIAGR